MTQHPLTDPRQLRYLANTEPELVKVTFIVVILRIPATLNSAII